MTTTKQKFQALVVEADGSTQLVTWDTTETGTLPHTQKAVGGWVDVVRLAENLDMWVNDEGICLGLEVNEAATRIAHAFGFTHQDYYGPAVFTGGADNEGQTLPLPDHMVAVLNVHRLA